jgi:phosphate-selective porin OprO/OprP
MRHVFRVNSAGSSAAIRNMGLFCRRFSGRFALAALCVPMAAPARADDAGRLDAAEQQLAAIRRELAGISAAPPPKAARASLNNGRFTVASATGDFSVSLRGTVQFDAGYFSQGHGPSGIDLNSGTNFRRAYFGLEGTAWRDWSYNIAYNFGGSGTEKSGYLYRAYIEYGGARPFAVRIGAFSPFTGIEDATGGTNLPFLERPTAASIARGIAGGSSRQGIELFAQGQTYLVSLAYTGAKTNESGTFDEQQALVGRAGWLAVNGDSLKWLLNVDATHVLKLADTAPGPAPSGFVTLAAGPEISVDGTETLDTGALSARHVTEFGLETAATSGRLFGQGGWFHYAVDRGGVLPDADFSGWYVMAAFSLTGEPRLYDTETASFHDPVPARPLGKGWGVWELAARFSHANLDDNPAAPAALGGVAGGIQDVWSTGVNWYPNRTLRFMLDYANIQVRHVEAPATALSANAIAMRSQIAF